MKNPHQLAHSLPMWKWIWATHKGQVTLITIITLIAITWAFITCDKATIFWICILMPIWYIINCLRWIFLYKKNLEYYNNWEVTFGSLKKNKDI